MIAACPRTPDRPMATPGDATPAPAPAPAAPPGPRTTGRVRLFDGLRFRHWQARARPDGVLVLTLDREGESVNTLAQAVLLELDALLERIAADPPKGLVFRSGKDSGFIAGADIGEFRGFDRTGNVEDALRDRKSTRLNSSHLVISYAVFCLK